jgi:uroporphyrinogen decarboxylase
MIETVFTPLAVLGEMVEEPGELRLHMRRHPNDVRGALEAVTATYERFVPRLIQAGADGIYLATTDWASRNLMSPEDYREWARPFDLRLLAAAQGAPFNVLHVCKRRNLLFELADYPVSAFSWDATDPTNPSLADGLARLPGAVMGGISQEEALRAADPESALEELRRGMEQTGGRRWLVGPGCSIPPAVPAANLKAIAAAVATLRPSDDRSAGQTVSPEVPR